MIEIKKFVKPEDLPKESVKIMLETAERMISDAKSIRKICKEALTGEIDPGEVENMLHVFRSILYNFDLSLSEVQKHYHKESTNSEEAEAKDLSEENE